MKLLRRINYYKEGNKVEDTKKENKIVFKIKSGFADIRKQI